MKYVSLVLLGLLIAVLAGCGGGGDGGKGDKITELTADLEAALGKLSTTEQTLKTTQGELTRTKKTLSDTQGTLSDTKEALSETQDTLSETQGTLSETQGTLSTTQGQLSTTQGQLETTKGSLTITQGVLETTQGQLTTTQGQLTTTQGELETARKDLASKETALNTLVLKAGVEDVTALSARLDYYKTVQNQVDALLLKAGVETLTALSTKLDTDDDAYDDLQTEVDAVLTATGTTTLKALQTAYDTAKTKNTDLQDDVDDLLAATGKTTVTAAVAEIERLDSEVTRLTGQVQVEQRKATEAKTEANQRVQTLEANQRAENLRKAFMKTPLVDNSDPPNLLSPLGTLPVTITVPTKDKLTFQQGDRTVSTTSLAGLRGAKLTRKRGGTDTTVVYTDRELSRKLLDHYGSAVATAKTAGYPGQFQVPTAVFDKGDDGTNFFTQSKSTVPIGKRVSLSYSSTSIPSSIASTVTGSNRTKTQTKASFSGKLHGVSGTFRCEAADCMLTATGTYRDTDYTVTADQNKLYQVTLSSSQNIYFKPDSKTATVSLCADTAQCLKDDAEYMAFGWWREEPANALADYKFGVFATIKGDAGANSSLSGEAEYDGKDGRHVR